MASTLTRTQSATPSVRISDPFTAMRLEMNDWLSNIWGGNGNSDANVLRGCVAPALDIAEKDNSFEIRMDIPGVDSKDLDVEVHGNTVTISGSRKEEKEETGKTFHRVERSSGCFSRTVTLPCGVSEKEVAAEYTNGVLSVVLPKSEEARPKKVAIKG
ncbi:MAG TPA: Hsp20/alpha crystallin family protein [Planctomycetaceae bacterium]|nr:Hsp20/alpha crystallin family protein [Planctomycetaceae bacterium]HQZ69097.1 Hsp20/alpha crystallin family protein [Planctomycetaceae bacterium]